MNKVYGSSLSPYVRKVMLTLELKGVPYENDPVIPFNMSKEFRAISPLAKIPVFEDDYIRLPDSSVICRYVEDKYPAHPVYPRDRIERAKAEWFEEYADTRLVEYLGPGIFLERLVKPFSGQTCNHAKVNHTINNLLPKEQDYLERQLPGSGMLFSDGLSIADFSIGGAFLNACYADYTVDKCRWPKLAAYLERVWQSKAFQHRIEDDQPMVTMLKGKQT